LFAFGVPFVQTKPKNEEANHVVSSLRKTMAAEHVQIQVAAICNCGLGKGTAAGVPVTNAFKDLQFDIPIFSTC